MGGFFKSSFTASEKFRIPTPKSSPNVRLISAISFLLIAPSAKASSIFPIEAVIAASCT